MPAPRERQILSCPACHTRLDMSHLQLTCRGQFTELWCRKMEGGCGGKFRSKVWKCRCNDLWYKCELHSQLTPQPKRVAVKRIRKRIFPECNDAPILPDIGHRAKFRRIGGVLRPMVDRHLIPDSSHLAERRILLDAAQCPKLAKKIRLMHPGTSIFGERPPDI